MTRRAVIAAATIALFFAGSLAVIAYVTRPGAPAPPPPTAVAAAGPTAPALPLDPAAGASVAPRSDPALAAVPLHRDATGRPRDFAPPPSIPAPAPTVRPAWLEGATQKLGPRPDPTPLGPLRPYVASALSRLQVEVAACAREAPEGAATGGPHGRTTLTLHLERLDNQLRIAEASPADGAAARDWRVQCAQRKLRGQTIYAPSKAGPGLQVPFVLNL